MLRGKVAVIYGAGGAIGAATARVFAREGARVHLVGRTEKTLQAVAEAIRADGGDARVAVVDAMDSHEVDEHAAMVTAADGGLDISLNAVGFDHTQGVGFTRTTVEDFLHPLTGYLRTNFVTAQAAARVMSRRGQGVLLTLSTPGARLSGPGLAANAAQSAALEGFSRALAGELGSSGVRVVCIRPHALSDATDVSYTGAMFERVARASGQDRDGFLHELAQHTLLGHLPTRQDVAEYAAFAASDRAASMTGAIANLTAGAIVD